MARGDLADALAALSPELAGRGDAGRRRGFDHGAAARVLGVAEGTVRTADASLYTRS